MDADFGIEEEPFFHSNFFKDWWEGAYKIGRIKLCRVYESVQMGNSSTETKSENLKILIYNVFDGEKSSKKIWGKKMFYKLFGSKQNSALNGRDI